MLEIKILAGAESKAFLVDLTKQIDRLQGLMGSGKFGGAAEPDSTPDEEGAEEESDFSSKPAAKSKKGASFEDETDLPEEKEEEEEPKPKKKAKKTTIDDVNDACREKARSLGKAGVAEVRKLLKKKFGTESISEIDDDQYDAVLKAMKV